jgi:ABC-type sugar transport system substrate-binding protein
MKKFQMSKKTVLGFVLILTVTAFAAAGGKNDKSATENSIKIGFSIATLTNPIWTNMYLNMERRAKELGVELFVNDANNIAAAQITAIENFISMGCQVIIVHAFDYEAAIPVVTDARAKGVKIICYDVKLPDTEAFFGVNNTVLGRKLGEMAGKWINQNCGGKGIVGIMGVPTITAILERENGIKSGIMNTAPDSEIVISVAASNTTEAVSQAENFLQAYPNMNCIVTITDAFALGAYEAYIAAGKSKANIGIFGCDAVPDALEAIAKNDIYRGTLFLDAVAVGGTMIDTAIKMARNEPYDADVPMEPDEVTYANVRQYMGK